MRMIVRALLVVGALVFALPVNGFSADLEWLGILSGFGGAERESIPGKIPTSSSFPSESSFGKAGGRGTLQALGVIPFGSFGVQASFQYVGGQGSRLGTTFGPLYDFTAGKAGLFATYQHRTFGDANLWWLEPGVDWYLPQINLSLRYIQPLSSPQTSGSRRCGTDDRCVIKQIAVNRLQATASYFPPDFLSLGKDNLELTGGVQVNSFIGPRVRGAGVGPVFGISMMPAQNVELQLVKGTVDNRSRYEIQTGLRIFFGKSMPSTSPATSPSLKELRRKYMEASPYPTAGYSGFRRSERPS